MFLGRYFLTHSSHTVATGKKAAYVLMPRRYVGQEEEWGLGGRGRLRREEGSMAILYLSLPSRPFGGEISVENLHEKRRVGCRGGGKESAEKEGRKRRPIQEKKILVLLTEECLLV